MISLQTCLQEGSQSLAGHTDCPRLEAEVLLAELLHKDRGFLFAHPDYLLSEEQYQQFQALILQRGQGIPIAYLTGKKEFWFLPLQVNQHTLIPRPETELLVEITLTLLPEKSEIAVLDLGTGSGAIALALAKERPHWQIDACDISQEALAMAKKNAHTLGLSNVNFYHSDWFNDLKPKGYDVIVANPPYIAENDPHLQQGDLRFEPLSALVSSQNGFADLQCIVKDAKPFLLPNALLLLEHGHDQKCHLATILKEMGYTDLQCWQDIQGLDRISGGLYKGDRK